MPDIRHTAEGWLEEHGDHLYRFAMLRVRDPEVALDLVQETLLAAWQGRDRFRGSSSLRTWLVGILKHKITDHIRREIRDRELGKAVENDPSSMFFKADGSWNENQHAWKEDPEILCRNHQFRGVLEDCLERLPDKQQKVFMLREMAGEATDAVCKICNITPTHAHVLLHRARLALRKCLEINWLGKGNSS
ncbi:MAG: sigma-70 family RNA polymerase sigma factor [Zetaproteobacteria bacterium]|nr:MAG: sigma-70 family RNA polymerase sigma factor [Zetaproteobacteria bacterium]